MPGKNCLNKDFFYESMRIVKINIKVLHDLHYVLTGADLSRSRYLKSLQYPYTQQTPKREDKYAAFRCPQCSKVYNRKGNLGRHMRYECGKSPQFHCYLCEKSFFRREKLDHHIKNHSLDKVALNQGQLEFQMYQLTDLSLKNLVKNQSKNYK